MQHPHPSGTAATPANSTLARLQQLIVFASVTLVAGWIAWSWQRPGWVVAAGGALLLFGYAINFDVRDLDAAVVDDDDAVRAGGGRRVVLALAGIPVIFTVIDETQGGSLRCIVLSARRKTRKS